MSKLLLSASPIVHYFGERKILDVEVLHVVEGDRIGIVGQNGAGKTTLLNILAGELEPDEGCVIRKAPVSYFKQFREDVVHVDLEQCRKLGLSGNTPLAHPSGGEWTRLGLAAMAQAPLLLFADEPTANLDADGVERCCQLLEQCGALLIVSHDRAVLDRLCNRIIEIEDGHAHFYTGNFSAYHAQKEKALKRQWLDYEQYRSEKSRLEQAARQRSQASRRIKKAPSRMGNSEARLHKRAAGEKMEKLDNASKAILSRLEQLEVKEKPREAAQVRIDFSLTDPPANRNVVTGEGITFGYGDRLIFDNAAFVLPKGSKTALIGQNGSGKTTLMNLMDVGAPGIRVVPKATIGYFRQNLDALDLSRSVMENVMADSVQSEKTMRGILARLLIRRDDVFKKAGDLSGGERVKLVFAKLFGSAANLLLLDEPTNFLDMPAIEALQTMVNDYEGTILFVSHDRAFVDGCATRLLRIENKKLLAFEGSLARWERQQTAPPSAKSMDSMLLELRLAEVIARLSDPNCPNKDELENDYQQLLAQKNKP